MSKCDSCTHPEVCKYKEEFQAFEKSQTPLDKPFSVEVKCQYFTSKAMPQYINWQLGYSNQLNTLQQMGCK